MGAQLGLARLGIAQGQRRQQPLAAARQRLADHGDLAHRRVAQKDRFDFGGIDAVAADFKFVIAAAGEHQAAIGAESLNPLTPLTTLLNYGPISPDGWVNVRILYDHRVMDGATVARALERFEAMLNGAVADEVAALT